MLQSDRISRYVLRFWSLSIMAGLFALMDRFVCTCMSHMMVISGVSVTGSWSCTIYLRLQFYIRCRDAQQFGCNDKDEEASINLGLYGFLESLLSLSLCSSQLHQLSIVSFFASLSIWPCIPFPIHFCFLSYLILVN